MSLTSNLANLSVASPEDSDKGGSVMRCGSDVVILSEEDMVTVLHTAETTTTHMHNTKNKRNFTLLQNSCNQISKYKLH